MYILVTQHCNHKNREKLLSKFVTTEAEIRRLIRESILSEKLRSGQAWTTSGGRAGSGLWYTADSYRRGDRRSRESTQKMEIERQAISCYFCANPNASAGCADSTQYVPGFDQLEDDFRVNIESLISDPSMASYGLDNRTHPVWRTRHHQEYRFRNNGDSDGNISKHMNVERDGNTWKKASLAIDLHPANDTDYEAVRDYLLDPANSALLTSRNIVIIPHDSQRVIHFESTTKSNGSVERSYNRFSSWVIDWAKEDGNCHSVKRICDANPRDCR
jgi:hypothetical protein